MFHLSLISSISSKRKTSFLSAGEPGTRLLMLKLCLCEQWEMAIMMNLPGQFNLKHPFVILFGWLIKFILIHLVIASEPDQTISQKPVSATN